MARIVTKKDEPLSLNYFAYFPETSLYCVALKQGSDLIELRLTRGKLRICFLVIFEDFSRHFLGILKAEERKKKKERTFASTRVVVSAATKNRRKGLVLYSAYT